MNGAPSSFDRRSIVLTLELIWGSRTRGVNVVAWALASQIGRDKELVPPGVETSCAVTKNWYRLGSRSPARPPPAAWTQIQQWLRMSREGVFGFAALVIPPFGRSSILGYTPIANATPLHGWVSGSPDFSVSAFSPAKTFRRPTRAVPALLPRLRGGYRA
jgi:hypothetical protein